MRPPHTLDADDAIGLLALPAPQLRRVKIKGDLSYSG